MNLRQARELQERIDELEKKVAELEARPPIHYHFCGGCHCHYPHLQPAQPFFIPTITPLQPLFPSTAITCGTKIAGETNGIGQQWGTVVNYPPGTSVSFTSNGPVSGSSH